MIIKVIICDYRDAYKGDYMWLSRRLLYIETPKKVTIGAYRDVSIRVTICGCRDACYRDAYKGDYMLLSRRLLYIETPKRVAICGYRDA